MQVIQIANALDSLRISENSRGLKILPIISRASPESLLIEIACMGVGIISSMLNENDSESDLLSKLTCLRPKCLAVDNENFGKILKFKSERHLQELELIISFDNLTENEVKSANQNGLRLISYHEYKKFEKSFSSKILDIKGTALILFTSGTTGDCKVVRISHEALMENLTGLVNASHRLTTEDVFITNGSLSIYSERVLIFMATIFGAAVGVSRNFWEDVRVLRPTLMHTNPRFLDFLHSTLQHDLSLESSMTQKLFQNSFSKRLKSFNKRKEVKKNLIDNMSFNHIREKFGTRLKLIFLSGGIGNIETMKFFKIVLGCDLIESYGCLETGEFILCSGRDLEYGHVGGPLSSCEVKLAYLEEIAIEGLEPSKYGELCIRHTSAPLGYLDESIVDSEGWVHTGDIFKINDEVFSFVFLDRVEFISKSKIGWAVLPQRLELVYRQSEFVAQILLCSDSRINGLVAVVVPNQNFVMKTWAGRASDFRSLCRDVELQKFIMKHFRELAHSKGLKAYEVVKELIIEPVPWTTKEFITNNLKLKRNALLRKYHDQIQELIQKIIISS